MKRINKTWALIIVLVILTAILLVASFALDSSTSSTPSPTPTRGDEQKEVALTKLEISSEPRVSTISGRYEVDINIDTDKNQITLTQLELSYDPKIIRIYNIKPGSFIDSPEILQKEINENTGRISYWLVSDSKNYSSQGTGTLATITFNKIGTESGQINFEPKTSVSAIGTKNSVLKEAISGIITSLPTPSPTPTRVITPIPTFESQ